MGRMIHVPPEILDRARELKAEGKSWGAIGREVGVDRDVIRWRIDPDYVASRKANPESARAMGDPLPGRSALDRRAT